MSSAMAVAAPFRIAHTAPTRQGSVGRKAMFSPRPRHMGIVVRAEASNDDKSSGRGDSDEGSSGRGTSTRTVEPPEPNSALGRVQSLVEKVGVSLGPIALSLGESEKKGSDAGEAEPNSAMGKVQNMVEDAGVSLGPIALSLGESKKDDSDEEEGDGERKSIASLTTEEWKKQHVKDDGTVSLWLEDDFNKASRFAGADEYDELTNVENVAWSGLPTGVLDAPTHSVKVTDHKTGEVIDLEVPEDRYVLFEMEQQGIELPNACRMGCCTKCTVKVTKGSFYQPQALGISKELKEQGYALLCVATPTEDVECVTQDEDEVYDMQFGQEFARLATDKDGKYVTRDDFALEIADMDE